MPKILCCLCSRRTDTNKQRVRVGSNAVWEMLAVHAEKNGLSMEAFTKQDYVCVKCHAVVAHHGMKDRGPDKPIKNGVPTIHEPFINKSVLRSYTKTSTDSVTKSLIAEKPKTDEAANQREPTTAVKSFQTNVSTTEVSLTSTAKKKYQKLKPSIENSSSVLFESNSLHLHTKADRNETKANEVTPAILNSDIPTAEQYDASAAILNETVSFNSSSIEALKPSFQDSPSLVASNELNSLHAEKNSTDGTENGDTHAAHNNNKPMEEPSDVSAETFQEQPMTMKGMRNTTTRSLRNALAMFLLLLRNNMKQEVIAHNFSTTQQVVSKTIDAVSSALDQHFVPKHLGYYHMTREEALEKHSIKLTSTVLGQSESRLCVIADGTYNYIEKPSDFELQRKTYSLHKCRNLLKPLYIVFPDGYILEAAGPYFCDSKNNDAANIRHHYNNSDLLLFLEEGDYFLLDRGYRDVVDEIGQKEFSVFMPSLLTGKRTNFDCDEANASRMELYLHGNRLTHLRQCDRYLPVSIQTLTLDHNNIADLNEICTLSGLTSLNSISIQENPCVQMTNSPFIFKNSGFDYRPFVLNWCMTVKIIDNFAVNPIESLKAEWLYSQGRGRQFRVGEQVDLAKYLSQVCPLTGEALENEEDRKLRLILSKAQQHQRQLKEEISDNSHSSANNSPSTNRRRSNRIQSPRVSRLGRASSGSPDSMSSSYHGNTSSSINDANTLVQMSSSLIENVNANKGNIMVQSLDPTILSSPTMKLTPEPSSVRTVVPPINDYQTRQCPLVATSKIVPVPETLMSPDCPPVNVVQGVIHTTPPKSETSLPNQKVSSIKSTKESKLMSPKSRTSLTKKHEKSPVLNVRKNNTINTALKANQTTNHHHTEQPSNHKKTLAHKTQSPSPKQQASYTVTPDNMSTVSSDDDSDHFSADKLKTIRNKAAQRSQEQNQSKDNTDASSSKKKLVNQNSTEESAIVIQKIWRGYSTRKTNKHIAENLQKNRTQQHIEKLSHDMETTKVALENERKIQQLQMQAINALWKKVSTLQPPPPINANAIEAASTANLSGLEPNSTAVVQNLAKTCSVLTNQVQQLQGSMRDIIQCMSVLCKIPQNQAELAGIGSDDKKPEVKDSSGTQTEIVAVHTPQVENLPFPFANKMPRPSTLSLTESNGSSSSIRKIPEKEADENGETDKKTEETDTSKENKDDKSEKSTSNVGDDNASKPKT